MAARELQHPERRGAAGDVRAREFRDPSGVDLLTGADWNGVVRTHRILFGSAAAQLFDTAAERGWRAPSRGC